MPKISDETSAQFFIANNIIWPDIPGLEDEWKLTCDNFRKAIERSTDTSFLMLPGLTYADS